MKPARLILLKLAILVFALATSSMEAQKKHRVMNEQVFYRTVKVDGLSIFYREAGPKAPTILFLDGLPSSSRMFQPLLTRLADNYHLVAPDYPGYGHSDWPDPKQFDYTFDQDAHEFQNYQFHELSDLCQSNQGQVVWNSISISLPFGSRSDRNTQEG